VMEHIAGETLAARLSKGPLPLDQSLRIATEVAEALSAAHRQGVIHRDLKPANVMLTKAGAKLLDFGLAKLTGHGEQPVASYAGSALPTQATPLTAQGVIVGTLQYMAPEQLEGKPPDARTDLWALGAILYEMLTGKRAFEGTSVVGVMSAIMEREPPPIGALQPLTPPALDRFVRRCLAKDPDARWQTAADAADELRWMSTTSGTAISPVTPAARRARRVRRAAVSGIAALAVLAVSIALWQLFSPTRPSPGILHLAVPVSSSGLTGLSDLALSRDGRVMVFIAEGHERRALWVRELVASDWHAPEPRPLEGTAEAMTPFFSPDGQHVAFWRGEGTLMRVAVRGGAPQKICDAAGIGGVWLPDNTIVFGGGYVRPGLWKVAADGGTPRAVVRPPKEEGTTFYRFPDVLPGGEGILFETFREGHRSLRLWTPKGERVLIEDAGQARFLPAGYLVYAFGDALRVQAVDAGRLLRDGAAALRGSLRELPVGPGWAVSDTGRLAYLPAYTGLARLVWRERSGIVTPLPFKPQRYKDLAIAPDGERFVTQFEAGTERRLFLASVTDGSLTPLTDGPDDCFMRFTRDGQRVVFTRFADGRYNVWTVTADGSNKLVRLDDRPEPEGAPEVHPNGKVVLFNSNEPELPDRFRVWQKTLPDGPATVYLSSPGESQINARFSPNGDWVAYMALNGGTWDVYVQPFPTGARRQVSVDGGAWPIWNPRGGEIFFESGGFLMSTAFNDGRLGKRERLFPLSRRGQQVKRHDPWDVHPDGRRFLMTEPVESATTPSQVFVVLNWLEELKAKVPPAR